MSHMIKCTEGGGRDVLASSATVLTLNPHTVYLYQAYTHSSPLPLLTP